MMNDIGLSKELSAMVGLEKALGDLSDDERGRVLAWASSRFNVALPGAKKGVPAGGRTDVDQSDEKSTPEQANSLAEFYDLAGPTSDAEKVLVVGYWFQYHDGVSELDAQSINSQLKHLGHGVGNVTRALEWHKSQKPALLIQKRKEGTSRQARKKFVVTNEGKKFVERMLGKTA